MSDHLRSVLPGIAILAVLAAGLAWWLLRAPDWERVAPVSSVLPRELADSSTFPPPGALQCKSCHLQEFEDWMNSQHAHANRLVNPLQDRRAFNPARTFR